MSGRIRPGNLTEFAFVNEDALRGEARGVVVNFRGFTDQDRRTGSGPFARHLGEKGVLYLLPYTNPWAWANDRAFAFADECLDALYEKYGLTKNETPFMAAGGSMGGMTALLYPLFGSYRPRAVAADCPVCDLRRCLAESEAIRCAFYDAYFHLDPETETARHDPMTRAGELPEIPYCVVSGGRDTAVREETQILPFLAGLRARKLDVTHLSVPDMLHCDLESFPEALGRYEAFCFRALGIR